MAYEFAKPDNGVFYTNIELEAIWAIPVDPELPSNTLESSYKHHLRASRDPKLASIHPAGVNDADAASLIEMAIVSEVVNMPPKGYCDLCNGDTKSMDDEICGPCLDHRVNGTKSKDWQDPYGLNSDDGGHNDR